MSWVRLTILAVGTIALLAGLFGSDADMSTVAFVMGAALVLVFAATNFGENSSEIDVRARDALEGLRRIHNPRAVEFMLQALQHKRDSRVRLEAIEGLRRAGNPRTLPHLLPALKDEEAEVRLAAIGAVRSLAPPLLCEPATAEGLARSFTEALEDAYAEVRNAAAEGLGAIGAHLAQSRDRAKVLGALSEFVERCAESSRREELRGNAQLARDLARRGLRSATSAIREIGDPQGAEVLTRIKGHLAGTDFTEEKLAVNQALIRLRVKNWMKTPTPIA